MNRSILPFLLSFFVFSWSGCGIRQRSSVSIPSNSVQMPVSSAGTPEENNDTDKITK